jgi:hypothetical protein
MRTQLNLFSLHQFNWSAGPFASSISEITRAIIKFVEIFFGSTNPPPTLHFVRKAPHGKTLDQIKKVNLTLTPLPNNLSLELPSDVLSQIFSFLDGANMVRLQQVSKEICAWMTLQSKRAEFIEECTITRTLKNKSWKIKTIWNGAPYSCFALDSKIFWFSHQVIHALDAHLNKYETYPFEQEVQWICPWAFIPNCIGVLLKDHFEILDLVAKERYIDEITDFTWMEPTKYLSHPPLPNFSIKMGKASYKVKASDEVVQTTQDGGSHTFFLRNHAKAFSPYNSIEINDQRYELKDFANPTGEQKNFLKIDDKDIVSLLQKGHHWFAASPADTIYMWDSKFQNIEHTFQRDEALSKDNHLTYHICLAVSNQKLYSCYCKTSPDLNFLNKEIDIFDLETKKTITSITVDSQCVSDIFILGTKLYLFLATEIQEIDFG